MTHRHASHALRRHHSIHRLSRWCICILIAVIAGTSTGGAAQPVVFDLASNFRFAEVERPMRRLDLRGLDLHARYLAGGWNPAVKGAWMGKHPAGVDVPIVERADLRVSMSLFAPPFTNLPAEMQFRQNLTVSWNGREIGSFDLDKGAQTLSFEVPAEVQRIGPNRLQLRARHSVPFRPRPGMKENHIAVRVDEIVFDSAGLPDAGAEADGSGRAVWPLFDEKTPEDELLQTPGSVVTYYIRPTDRARLIGRVGLGKAMTDSIRAAGGHIQMTIAEDGKPERVVREWSLDELDSKSSAAIDEDISDFAGRSTALSLSYSIGLHGGAGSGSREAPLVIWSDVRVMGAAEADTEGTGEIDLAGGIAGKPARRPNIFLILFDTLRADHTEPYGATNVKTPSMLRLASRGVTFDAAFSNACWTRPSVASMMTSIYPRAHQVGLDGSSLPGEVPYLPEIFHDNGYRTLGIVNNPNVAAAFGFDRGMDEFHELFRIEKNLHRLRHSTPESQADYVWDEYVAPFVGAAAEQPFFIYLHELDPHAPYEPLPPYDSMYPNGPPRKIDTHDYALLELHKQIERGEAELEEGDLDYIDSLYRGEISFMDAYLGRLLDRIEREGLDSNTLIIFVSDHGEAFMEHGTFCHQLLIYDELLRVPLIMSMPGLIPEGMHVKENVELVDLMPTLLALLDIDSPATAQGRSLTQLISRPESAASPERPLFASWMMSETIGHDSIRLGRFKLIRRGTGATELYDTDADFYEQNDLYSSRPIAAGNLLRMLDTQREVDEALAGTIEHSRVELDDIDPEILGDLKALGYIE